MSPSAHQRPRLSGADWDHWVATGHPQVVTDKEAGHFHRCVRPRPGMTAADLGCGTGQWTRQLAAWGLNVTGYDFSAEALRQAAAAGLSDGLSYVQWDVNAEPIPQSLQPGSLDLVTCRYVFPYLEHGRLLTDVGRWLKPTGALYALVRVRPDPQGPDEEPTDAAGRDTSLDVFHRGLTEAQLRAFGAGWAHHEMHRLSPQRCAIVLRGYGTTAPEPQDRGRRGRQTPGAGGDAPSPERNAPAPGPHGLGATVQAEASRDHMPPSRRTDPAVLQPLAQADG
ncbi:class I SAM-dependent methyltransferase [Streptomyces sp. CA-251387]|uniref:class I SAM-dependent methyltransferase n=1 Tax=Streptomyces sp. CA-251387 TaxID=3240064 RepID=UPI003D8E10E5